ncbi:IclR family transcriptional regulator [Algihabitans albus]|uniref:IclR family transcriptional regulator n=1 Tax=Algihabitans albus TaxID=2164067 RepID=UPI000E5C9DC0|nr:IclR family transcriptional regulator [Algihabitans albus]
MRQTSSDPRRDSDPADGSRRSDGATLPRVRAVSRAIAIMRTFTPEQPRLSLSAVAESAGLDAGTTRRILVTLRDEGIVEQDAKSGQYALTLQAMRFAGAVPDGQSLRDLAEDLLRGLADEVGATAFLSVARGHEAICLARFHGQAPVEVRWWALGMGRPLNCGAAPRLLLAHLPVEEQDRILAQPLATLTDKSITDPDLLRVELDEIRRNGWAFARDDVALGLSAVAAPVRDDRGLLVAAMSLGGLTPQIFGDTPDGDGRPRALSPLLDCCARLSDRISGLDFIS